MNMKRTQNLRAQKCFAFRFAFRDPNYHHILSCTGSSLVAIIHYFLGRLAVAVSVLLQKRKKKVAVSHSAKNKKTKESPYKFQRMETPHQSSESCTINLQLLPKRMSHQVWLLLSQKLRETHRNKRKKRHRQEEN